MPIKYIPYYPDTVQGQAILNNITRTRRALRYRDSNKVYDRIKRGMPYYELEKIESVGNNPENMLIRGECFSACAYLKDKGIKVDLVYIDPPFASGADYAKKVYLRRNPKVAEAMAKAEEEIVSKANGGENGNGGLDLEELRAFEEKMYGDIWNKEDYLNWMYENLMAIKAVMSETASIYVHLDWHVGHYVKVLMDEVFGEDNFRNEIIVKRIKKNIRERELVNALNNAADMLLFYAISDEVKILPPTKEEYRDERWHSFEASGYRNGMDYDLFGFKPSSNNHWRWEVERASKAIVNYNEWLNKYSETEPLTDYWRRTGENIDFLRSNARTKKPEYFIPTSDETLCDSIWDDIPAYAFKCDYSTEKSEDLLERIIQTYPDETMLVADFFGGSGVTAKVAHDLKRKFIHVDVGINSIQTARDRLIAAGAEFDIYDVKDGVSLFRNPAQTMDKLKTLITGLKNEDSLVAFWEGAINDSKLGMIPVYIPNLLDHSTKVLDIPLMNRVINEAMQELPDDVEKVIVYYVDIEDEDKLNEFIEENNATEIKIELRDLKEILDEVVLNDEIDYEMKKTKEGYEIEFKSFTSDRLKQKIDAFNQKKALGNGKNNLFDTGNGENGNNNGESEEENGNGKKVKKEFKPIEISETGLELIELVSLDCTNKEDAWESDTELKIDKNGYVILNGKKTKQFWDGKIVSKKKPLRLKVRNIAGDESIIALK